MTPAQLRKPLSAILWASTGSAFAQQLVPMVPPPTEQPTLTSMKDLVPMSDPSASQAVTATALVPMEPAAPLTASLAHTTTALVPMQPKTSPTRIAALVPMADAGRHEPPSPTLTPMLAAIPDSDTVVTPLERPGKPEIMHGRTEKKISNPVPALEPLAPPLQITPTGQKPLILKLIGGKPKRVIAATTGSSGYAANQPADWDSSKNAVILPNQLTDAELSPNPSIPTITRPDDQMVPVDVTLNGIQRQGVMELYQDNQHNLWFPLTPLAQLLEMPLNVNAAAGVAQGWYQSPSNNVLINMASGKTTIGKQTFPTGKDVEKHSGDLYITDTALKKWFGVESALNYNDLRLSLTTPQPLPGDLHASRLVKWDKAEQNRLRNAIPSDTIIPPYSDFSLPVFRVGASTQFNKPAQGSAATATGLTLQSSNDMFGTNSNVALSFTQQFGNPDLANTSSGLTGGSVLLQKQSETPDLLGSLHARYFGLGDITTAPVPLSGLSSRGRGFRVNDLPEGAVSNPDQYVVTGPAPINWDAEVYQDATLVAYSRIDSSGTYRFTALPLKAGRNVFRIVLYGPNGERDERTQTIYLADNLPLQGETRYDAAVFQQNRALIPGLPNQPSSTAVTAQTQFITGITNKWAATVSAFQSIGSTFLSSETRPEEKGASVGLRGSVAGTYLTADAFTGGTGNSVQTTLRTPLTNTVDLRLSQTRNMGFTTTERDDLTTSQAELDVPFKIGKTAINNTYGYTNTTYQDQLTRHDYTQRTSVGLGPVNATNQLQYTTQGANTNINGTFDSTVHVFNKSFRAGLNYQPNAQDVMQSYYFNTQLPVPGDQTVNLTYTQQLASSHLANLAGSMYWNTGPLSVGLQGQAGSNGNLQLGLNLATALVPEDYNKAKWKFASPNSTIGQGQAAVRVYADENNNNRYDPGEALLPNVTIYNRQRGSQKVTNANGIATFADLIPNTLTRLDLDLTSLPDIYLKPVSDTLNVKPHVGDNGTLDYAVKVYGEISGQALTKTGQPIQNLGITLRDAANNKVDSTLTEYDGYFTFGALPMGSYTLVPAGTSNSTTTITVSAKSRIKAQNLIITNPGK